MRCGLMKLPTDGTLDPSRHFLSIYPYRLRLMLRHYALVCGMLVLTACQPEPLDFQLTPITQTGANTLSCTVDGTVFVPYGRRCVGFGGGCDEGIRATYNSKRGQLLISAVHYGAGRDEFISVSGDSIFRTGEHSVVAPITGRKYAGVGYVEQNQNVTYATTATYPSSVLITRLDTVAHIISGTFAGYLPRQVPSPTPQTGAVLVKDGRFDVVYSR